MKFAELGKYKIDTSLIVSPRHEKWLQLNSNPVYSEGALEFAQRAIIDMGRPRDRRGTISASSSGSCRRKQQFTFIGLPELPPTPKLAQIFQNGTFMHIRWQMAGLTEGWLSAAEVPVGENKYRLSGTQDGVAFNSAVVELKSINSNGYSRVVSFGAQEGHKIQLGTYLLTTGADLGTIIYENKDTQEFHEFVYPASELPLKEIREAALEMWDRLEKEELYEPLDACWNKSGYQYHGCPFRKQCLEIKSWEQAKELAV